MLSSIAAGLWAKVLWLFSLSTLQSIVGILFALGLVIFVHELGHFLACRALGIRVQEFALGWGRVLKKWKRGDTVYSLRAIPVGGFVTPGGENYTREAEISSPSDFAAKPWWKRAIMVFSGAAMNYVLAFFIFFFVVWIVGLPVSDAKKIPPVVGEVMAGYPAANSGLHPGDVITTINGAPIANWGELLANLSASGEVAQVAYSRAGQQFDTAITLAQGKIGVTLAPIYESAGILKSAGIAAHQCYYWTALSLKTIGEKLWQRQAPDVAGPIGIFEIVGKGVHSGMQDYFFLIGLISVAIGMFNLFPIPILDGGHIVFFVIEALRGKKVKEKTLGIASMIGAGFLLLVVVYATYSDISRIANRGAQKPAAAASQEP